MPNTKHRALLVKLWPIDSTTHGLCVGMSSTLCSEPLFSNSTLCLIVWNVNEKGGAYNIYAKLKLTADLPFRIPNFHSIKVPLNT